MTAVLDTCVVLWLLGEPDRLSRRAAEMIGDQPLGVPAVVLLELAYLQQVGRLEPGEALRIRDRLLDPGGTLVPMAFGVEAALHAAEIPRSVSTDPFDRMVAGTALAAGLPLVTADSRLREVPGLTVIW